jgi:hypothetical protein
MTDATLAARAVAPIDVMGPASQVASSLASAGSVIGGAASEVVGIMNAQKMEKLRRQALIDLQANGIEVKPEMTAEEISKGVARLGAGKMIYDHLRASNKDITLPDEKQFKNAIFNASDQGFNAWHTTMLDMMKEGQTAQRKTKEEEAKQAGSGEAIGDWGKLYQELELANDGKEVTREQLYAEGAKRGLSPEKLGGIGAGQVEKIARPTSEIERIELAKKRVVVDEGRANVYRNKVGDDKFNADLDMVEKSVDRYSRLVSKKSEYETKAAKLESEREQVVGKGGSAEEIDKAVLKLLALAKQHEQAAKTQRANALTAMNRFDIKYKGARIQNSELDEELSDEVLPVDGGQPEVQPKIKQNKRRLILTPKP